MSEQGVEERVGDGLRTAIEERLATLKGSLELTKRALGRERQELAKKDEAVAEQRVLVELQEKEMAELEAALPPSKSKTKDQP